ncbi:MAG: leucine-rich repeat domain-containing protein [Bacteroidaceae bacterium]|nr:leucine-rich repeat domain-containing protein [Bacteroidaceae bacterium]
MKTILRKIFLSAAALLLATAVHAYDFSVENKDDVTIYYNILSASDKTCEVAGYKSVSTDVTVLNIPQKVKNSSTTFTVTRIANLRGQLVSVTIPNSVTSIGDGAFSYCQKLTSIDIPNSVTSLGAYAFDNCYALSSVHLSNSITSIGNSTFKSCHSLTSIVIPASVTSIGDNAFNDCIHLSSIDIPNSVTEIRYYAFNNCTDLSSVRLPNSLKTIYPGAFRYCQSLTSIDIPNSVTSIESSVFERCKSLTSVTLGSSLKSIGEHAFAYCDALMKVDTRIENPFQINKNVFPTQVKTVGVLHVPVGKKAVYRATVGWSDFVNVEDDGTYVPVKLNENGGDFQAFCPDEPLDFRSVLGLKAYIAGGFDPSTNEILLVSVNEVPASTGVILEGVEGKTYQVLVSETSFVYSNLLRGTLSQTTISDGYVLRGDQFERVESNTIVAANSAYLTLPASVQGPSTLSLKCMNGVTDGIDTVLTDITPLDGHWYNLQGMRLDGSPSTPGIYIRNGRKVMVR